MFEIFQKILLVTIISMVSLTFLLLEYNKYSSRSFVEENIEKVQKLLRYILIGSMVTTSLNVTPQIILLEITASFWLILLMYTVNIYSNKAVIFMKTVMYSMFFIYLVAQVIIPFLDY